MLCLKNYGQKIEYYPNSKKIFTISYYSKDSVLYSAVAYSKRGKKIEDFKMDSLKKYESNKYFKNGKVFYSENYNKDKKELISRIFYKSGKTAYYSIYDSLRYGYGIRFNRKGDTSYFTKRDKETELNVFYFNNKRIKHIEIIDLQKEKGYKTKYFYRNGNLSYFLDHQNYYFEGKYRRNGSTISTEYSYNAKINIDSLNYPILKPLLNNHQNSKIKEIRYYNKKNVLTTRIIRLEYLTLYKWTFYKNGSLKSSWEWYTGIINNFFPKQDKPSIYWN